MIPFKKRYEKFTDEELVRYIVKGHEKAFDELYQRYARKLHAYFYRNLGKDNSLANDFLQELFLKVIEKGELFDPQKKFSVWIYAVAGNLCKNEYRRIQRHAVPGLPEELPNHLFTESGAADKHDSIVFGSLLQKELDKMEASHRECFLLRFQQELSIKEISEILECPEGTVKSRIFYTLKKLAESLKYFKPDHLKKKEHEISGKKTGRPAAAEKL